jgi:hypothetical protein
MPRKMDRDDKEKWTGMTRKMDRDDKENGRDDRKRERG